MNELIQKKANEIAEKHIRILENECQKACERFNVTPDLLTIEYHVNAEFKIKVHGSHFRITNNFIFENGSYRESENENF